MRELENIFQSLERIFTFHVNKFLYKQIFIYLYKKCTENERGIRKKPKFVS